MGATMLETLIITEVSGVDDPANQTPGWMVVKAANVLEVYKQLKAEELAKGAMVEGALPGTTYDETDTNAPTADALFAEAQARFPLFARHGGNVLPVLQRPSTAPASRYDEKGNPTS